MSKETSAWSEYCKSLSPAIAETCARVPVSTGPTALVKALDSALEDWNFRHTFARGGWYRLGGVVDAAGERLSDNLEAWLEEELAARDGDIDALCDDYADQELYATRLVGQTHYLCASVGDEHDDFLQLEIEDLQEMRAHRLFTGEPATLEELTDPRSGNGKLLPLGLPFYTFRRVQHVGALLRRMLVQKPEPAAIHRMLADWGESSAGHTSAFCNHWVIATREHLDRYQQSIVRAQPIPTLAGNPPDFDASPATRQLPLQQALNHFDREVGYPMAWFFHMLTTKAVPHWVAQAVIEDALDGFAYLPPRDLEVVRHWLHAPYTP